MSADTDTRPLALSGWKTERHVDGQDIVKYDGRGW